MTAKELSSPPIVTVTLDTEVGRWVEYDEDGEPIGRGRTIADAIIEDTVSRLTNVLNKQVEKLVREQLGTEIKSQVATVITAVVSEPVCLTNMYGEYTGSTMTVREHIAEEIKKQLTARPSNSYSDRASVLKEIIANEVKSVLVKDLRAVVEEARNKVVGAVRDQAATLIAQAVKDGLRK